MLHSLPLVLMVFGLQIAPAPEVAPEVAPESVAESVAESGAPALDSANVDAPGWQLKAPRRPGSGRRDIL